MYRAIKRIWLVPALMLWGGYSVLGFSLAGPIGGATQTTTPDAYQVPLLGYNLSPPTFGVDVVAPKNLGEGYRWNTRNVYYAFDASFFDYFGTNGAAAVDAAFAILNSLSNVDAYSPGLSEWPLRSSRVNYTAGNAQLLDLKSYALIEMLEQLGLAEPDRYAFCLHDRFLPGGAMCPAYEYDVIERNYDPVTQNYSTYVNGVLYTFHIIETCPFPANPYPPMVSDAATVVVDPDAEADSLSAVAAGQFNGFSSVVSGLGPTILGRYYVGLTRDDVGGLRYLWSSNTIINEQVESNSLLQLPSPLSIVVTSNLAQLDSDSLTNNQAALQALYPTLQITGSSPLGFAFVAVTNFILVTNPPPAGSVAGTSPTTNLVPIVTSNALPTFSYTFGNVITNFTFTNNGVLTTNSPSEYLLVPSNQCGFSILFNALTSVVTTTNTNLVVTVFTNHALAVDIFSCISNSVALREGVEKMNFFRIDYDSLVGQANSWGPITNTYTLTAITNSRPFTQTFHRVISQPDILFSASDLSGGPATAPVPFAYNRTFPNFNQANILPGLAGPGTIAPQVHITLNKVGPLFIVEYPSFLVSIGADNTYIPRFLWASFDGSTNAPVVYPVNTAYQSLVNSIFLQFTTPGSLPNGNVSVPYSTLLSATGATPPPYNYAVVTNSGSLPPGLNLLTVPSGGTTNTFISGTPTATGIFDFSLSVADTNVPPRTSARDFSIEIDP